MVIVLYANWSHVAIMSGKQSTNFDQNGKGRGKCRRQYATIVIEMWQQQVPVADAAMPFKHNGTDGQKSKC